jgi:hypothetical protein
VRGYFESPWKPQNFSLPKGVNNGHILGAADPQVIQLGAKVLF